MTLPARTSGACSTSSARLSATHSAPRGLLCTRLLLENADRGELAIAAVDNVVRDETRRATENRDEATIGAAHHLASVDCFVRADLRTSADRLRSLGFPTLAASASVMGIRFRKVQAESRHRLRPHEPFSSMIKRAAVLGAAWRPRSTAPTSTVVTAPRVVTSTRLDESRARTPLGGRRPPTSHARCPFAQANADNASDGRLATAARSAICGAGSRPVGRLRPHWAVSVGE